MYFLLYPIQFSSFCELSSKKRDKLLGIIALFNIYYTFISFLKKSGFIFLLW